MNEIKLTVYLTNYNYGHFIRESIESILSQSFKDFELIIIDDGSTDNSVKIIQEYESRQNIYTVFQKNSGLTKSNNLALKLSRGKYIVRVDADDVLAPAALEKMIEVLENDTEAVLVFPDYYNIDESGELINHYQRFDFTKNNMLLEKPAHGAVTMIRTDFLKSVGGYDEEFNCQDGYNLWLKVFKNHKVKNIPEPLFYYRQHGSNLTKNQKHLYHTRAEMLKKYAKTNNLPRINTTAILPVRGSKIDPRSTPMMEMGSKKLIDWTIEAALESDLVDIIMVTTPDSNLISYIQQKYAGKVLTHLRDISLARINSDILATLKDSLDYLKSLNIQTDAVLTLYTEYPFRCSKYIDTAINHLNIYEVDAVESVISDSSIFYKHDGNSLKCINRDSFLKLESEDIFRRSGGIHLIKTSIIENGIDIWKCRTGHIILDEMAAFRISSNLDIKIANFLAQDMEKN